MNILLGRLKNSRIQVSILVLTWSITNCLLYFQSGIQPVLESLKYINAAETLIKKGELPSIRYFFYLSTILVIAFSNKIGTGLAGAVFIQLLASLFATIYFYKSLQVLQKNHFSSFITTLLLTCCIPFYTWNFYLYTESLFYSFVLIFFSYCIKQRNLTLDKIVIQLALLLFVIISRPLGILFLPCWIVYLLMVANKKYQSLLIGLSLAGVTILIFVVNTILGSIKGWQPLLPAEFNYIICDIPTGQYKSLEHLKNKSPINQIFQYILQYPLDFTSLATERLKAFYLLVRSYYSAPHNLYLILLAAAFYIPIIFNLFSLRKKFFTALSLFSMAVIFTFTIAIMLQCDDYHNRFHNALIPVFLFLGVFTLINNLKALITYKD